LRDKRDRDAWATFRLSLPKTSFICLASGLAIWIGTDPAYEVEAFA